MTRKDRKALRRAIEAVRGRARCAPADRGQAGERALGRCGEFASKRPVPRLTAAALAIPAVLDRRHTGGAERA